VDRAPEKLVGLFDQLERASGGELIVVANETGDAG
jgi:hypothetical protein